MTDNYWQAAAAHDSDFERRFAPWNQPDADPEPTLCAWCEAETDNGLSDHGDIVCDVCLVKNAVSSGEWSSESIAASRRMTPDPSTC